MTDLTARARQLMRGLGLVEYVGSVRCYPAEERGRIEAALRAVVESAVQIAEREAISNVKLRQIVAMDIAKCIRREILGE